MTHLSLKSTGEKNVFWKAPLKAQPLPAPIKTQMSLHLLTKEEEKLWGRHLSAARIEVFGYGDRKSQR